jgi:hypothetical protein
MRTPATKPMDRSTRLAVVMASKSSHTTIFLDFLEIFVDVWRGKMTEVFLTLSSWDLAGRDSGG